MTRARTDWAAVTASVSREPFIPDRVWRHDADRWERDLAPVDRATEPQRWAAMVADDEPVITQVDNGSPADDGTGMEVTSSCSDRRVVAEMLAALDAEPRDKVLEIGTGTGWNAALLASVVGAENLTTVEVDAVLADAARDALAAARYGGVTVVTGDGAEGWPHGAPYDRLIATVGTATVPGPWVFQLRVGGRLVAPLNGDWYPPGLAVLERTDNGAVGRLAGPASFMRLRAQARSRAVPLTSDTDTTDITHTDVHPYYLTADRAAAVAIDQHTNAITFTWRSPDDSAEGLLWLYAPQCWATIEVTSDGPPYEVEQHGPRRLVDEVLAGYRWWLDAGSPPVEAWRVTVTPTGQHIELADRG